MASELQRLVDNLGNRLGRSVAIDDPDMHLLAYNAHSSEVDSARTGSILQRSVPREVVDHVYASGAGATSDLFLVPARADLGLQIPRIGMPVHHQGSLLAFVWLLGSEGPVTEEQTDAVRRAAETVAIIMHREYLLGALTRGRERELTRDLLSDAEQVRRSAADQLIADNLFSTESARSIVIEILRPDGGTTEQDQLALAAGAELGRSHRSQRHVLTLERPDHAIVLLTADDRPDDRPDDPVRALGAAMRERVLAEAEAGCSCWIGIGGIRSDLADIQASYLEARRAADVAKVVQVLGPVVRSDELGVYGLLAELPQDTLAAGLPPGLRVLFDRAQGDDALVETLETFLDNAGDVKQTAEQLHIHRTSLYYRLRRVEEISGLDLSLGDDRLALHLGLRIARLIDLRH